MRGSFHRANRCWTGIVLRCFGPIVKGISNYSFHLLPAKSRIHYWFCCFKTPNKICDCATKVDISVIVGLYLTSCGINTLLSTKRTNLTGYYAFGNLNNGTYIITLYHFSYSFIPESDVVLIPQVEIQSYDFTATEDLQL